MVVREDLSGRGWFLFAGVTLLVLLVALAAWFAGRHLLYGELLGDGVADGAALLDRYVEENRSLRDELAVYRNGKELARDVEERVRVENRDLQDRVAELEQALAYYRRVAMPDKSGKGLRIERMDIAATGTDGLWALSILLMRTGETDGMVEGRLEGRVVAEGPAGRLELPLAQVLRGRQDFNVRYAGDITAEIQLPAGAVPVRMDVVAVLTAPRQDRVEKSWQRQAARPSGGK